MAFKIFYNESYVGETSEKAIPILKYFCQCYNLGMQNKYPDVFEITNLLLSNNYFINIINYSNHQMYTLLENCLKTAPVELNSNNPPNLTLALSINMADTNQNSSIIIYDLLDEDKDLVPYLKEEFQDMKTSYKQESNPHHNISNLKLQLQVSSISNNYERETYINKSALNLSTALISYLMNRQKINLNSVPCLDILKLLVKQYSDVSLFGEPVQNDIFDLSSEELDWDNSPQECPPNLENNINNLELPGARPTLSLRAEEAIQKHAQTIALNSEKQEECSPILDQYDAEVKFTYNTLNIEEDPNSSLILSNLHIINTGNTALLNPVINFTYTPAINVSLRGQILPAKMARALSVQGQNGPQGWYFDNQSDNYNREPKQEQNAGQLCVRALHTIQLEPGEQETLRNLHVFMTRPQEVDYTSLSATVTFENSDIIVKSSNDITAEFPQLEAHQSQVN